MLKRVYFIPLLTSILFILSGCVTQKKKEDVGPVKKFYHDVTAEFNGYYNATILLDESIVALDNQYQDNYNKVLPIWKYSEADNPQAVASDLDEAKKKMAVVISLHRPSHWIDDCYLLMGKADFLRKDYETAEETILYMLDEFNPNSMSKKKAAAAKRKVAKTKTKKGQIPTKEELRAMSKKQRQKYQKKKKKQKEKDRKAKQKEIKKRKKARKKGKKVPPKKDAVAKKDEPKKKDESKKTPIDESDLPIPTSVRLGNLDPELPDADPEKYVLKHRPAYQEGVLWMARTYVERENYYMAEKLIDQLKSNPATFEDVREELAAVEAHFFMNQKKYDAAVAPLQTAIELSQDKGKKARYSYILGQIHQRSDKSDAAFAAFESVLKYRPPYEMEFNARLKMAVNSWKTGKGTAEDAKRNLNRMLKDIKNEEYLDAIYFALADIAMSQGNREEAIAMLQKSVWNSVKNNSQKVEAYLLLADMFYEDELYVEAHSYYDSTFQIMPKNDERWPRVDKLNSNLADIAENMTILITQDSLLAISKLSDEEKAIAAARIKKQRDEERRAKVAAETRKAELLAKINARNAPPKNISNNKIQGIRGGGNNKTGVPVTSSFFAYGEDRELKRAKRDFERKFGVRDLADNWRRAAASTFDGTQEDETEVVAENLDEDAIKDILKDVPETPEQIAAAEKAIESALFELGRLFRDRLENYEKTVANLERLLERFPDTQYQLDAMYYLHLAYTEMGNTAKANYYKDKIVNSYPNSIYASVLTDPNYLKNFESEEGKLNSYYDETLATFQSGNHQGAYDRLQQVGNKFGSKNKLQPRFALLNAMTVGSLQGKDAYVNGLKQVVAKYPETPESVKAKDILRILGAVGASGPGQARPDLAADSPFSFEEGKLHYMLVVLKDKSAKMNDAKIGVSDYNRKYHKLDKLRISNIYLGGVDNKVPMIVIRRYKNKGESMKFYDGVQKNSADFLPGFEYELFPITQNNYRAILKAKSLDGYKEFFELYYLD